MAPITNDVVLDARDVADAALDSHIGETKTSKPKELKRKLPPTAPSLPLKARVRKRRRRKGPMDLPGRNAVSRPAQGEGPSRSDRRGRRRGDRSSQTRSEPASAPKQPASSLNPEKVRQKVRAQIRKELLPASPDSTKTHRLRENEEQKGASADEENDERKAFCRSLTGNRCFKTSRRRLR
jgi:hypothetical protein